jgi:uncharacterized protein (TIGR03435 family)
MPDGRFTGTNVPPVDLLQFAYNYTAERMLGLPQWAVEERFDVAAKATMEPGAPRDGTALDRIGLMMRSLLAERFKLSAHTEMRDGSVYELRLSRADGRLGPQLVPAIRRDCQDMAAGRGGLPPLVPDPNQPRCGIGTGGGILRAGGASAVQLANALTRLVGRPVIDRTGLQGSFDAVLTFTLATLPPNLPLDASPPDPNAPLIFTAIQEQLGLKLQSSRAPVDVLVIDHIERPDPD